MDEPFKEIGEANNGKNKTVKTMKVKCNLYKTQSHRYSEMKTLGAQTGTSEEIFTDRL